MGIYVGPTEIWRLGCKINHQQPAFRIFANQKPNCLSIVFAEKHPGAFSNCCAISCYINVKIVKYLWWHGYNGHRMMDAGVTGRLCSALLRCHNINTRRYSLDPGPDHTPTLYTVTTLNQAQFCRRVMKILAVKLCGQIFLLLFLDEISFLTLYVGALQKTTKYYILAAEVLHGYNIIII